MGLTQSTPQQEPEIEEAHKNEHDEGECAGCEKEEECKSEPYNPNLVGTVGYFTKAVVVCSGTMEWPSKLEKSPGNFVHTLFSAIKTRDDIKDRPKITACAEKSSGEGYDIYVYPDEVKYLGIKEGDISVFIEDVLVKGEISTRLRHVSVSGKYHVLVCTHASRDKRCGRAGNQVLTALQEMVKEKNIVDRVTVDGCSHIGGHKYAGVVVVYPHGDFYGYIGAKNVDSVVQSYLDPKKPRANQYWRGRMGIDEDQQAKEAGLTAPKKKKDKGEKRREGEKGEKKEKEGGEKKGQKEEKKEESVPTKTESS